MKNYYDLALLLLRIGFGGFMLTHGIPKIEMLFKDPIDFPDPIGLGPTLSLIGTIIGEVIAQILIIIGYQTRLATIPSAFTMIIIAFVIHAEDALGVKEHALLFLIVYIALFLTGPGKYSIDGRNRNRL